MEQFLAYAAYAFVQAILCARFNLEFRYEWKFQGTPVVVVVAFLCVVAPVVSIVLLLRLLGGVIRCLVTGSSE